MKFRLLTKKAEKQKLFQKHDSEQLNLIFCLNWLTPPGIYIWTARRNSITSVTIQSFFFIEK